MELSGRPLFDNPVDDALFVPRTEGERLEENSRHGINTLVLGDPGSGKTSLLRNVLFRLRESKRQATWIDGAAAESVVDLLALIEDGLRGENRGFPLPPRPTLSEAAEVTALIRRLRNRLGGDARVIVLLDLAPGGVDPHDLFGRFRDELWQLPLTWIVAAPRSMQAALRTPPANAFFEDVIELSSLSAAQQRTLIDRRLEPGESLPSVLPDDGEGNPRRLLQIVRESMRTGDPVEAHFVARSVRDAELESLGSSARAVYEYLEENGPTSASDEDLLTYLSWSRQRAQKVLGELEDQALVRGETRQGDAGRPRRLFAIVPPSP